MFISDFAIKRPIVTIVAMLALVVFGLFALLKLKTDEFPDVAPAGRHGGADLSRAPRRTGSRREVIDPIEEAIASISGVKQRDRHAPRTGSARSWSSSSSSKPLAEATQDIRDAISGDPRRTCRRRSKEPIIKKFNDTDLPIVSLALVVDRC